LGKGDFESKKSVKIIWKKYRIFPGDRPLRELGEEYFEDCTFEKDIEMAMADLKV
jgi:hypothetical protein